MGTCYLCQPPKKTLADKVTHRIFAINEDRSNRLDLVFNEIDELIDYYFCSIENGRRVPVDPETEKKVAVIIVALRNKSVLTLVEEYKANPIWVGGEISPDASKREFELNTLDWPEKIAETILDFQRIS